MAAQSTLDQPEAADIDAQDAQAARQLIRRILTNTLTDNRLLGRDLLQVLINSIVGDIVLDDLLADDGRAIQLGQRALCFIRAQQAALDAAEEARHERERFERRVVELGARVITVITA